MYVLNCIHHFQLTDLSDINITSSEIKPMMLVFSNRHITAALIYYVCINHLNTIVIIPINTNVLMRFHTVADLHYMN